MLNVLFLSWQNDEVVLQCVAAIQKENRKFCLSAEGLGNRLCYLEPTSEAKVKPHVFWETNHCFNIPKPSHTIHNAEIEAKQFRKQL